MGKQNIEEGILEEGFEDWVPIDRLIGLARDEGAARQADFKAITRQVLESLLSREELAVGVIGDDGFEAWAGNDSPTFGAVDSGGVLSIRTAKLFRVLWIRLLKCALETLGPRELFLRTGYAYSDLARAATPLLKQFLAEGEWVIAWEDEPA